LEHWIPNTRKHAKELEAASILGPFFRITALQGQRVPDTELSEIAFEEANFQVLRAKKNEILEKATHNFDTIHNLQYEVLFSLLKSSPENREKVLEWIGSIIRRNKDRFVCLFSLILV
jgi:hypothetical protein